MNLEDMSHFEVGGNTDEGDADIQLTCLRCPVVGPWLTVSPDEDGPGVNLADLFQRAEKHLEEAHR